MMKYFVYVLFNLIIINSSAQSTDSVLVNQVDSLLKISKNYADNQNFEKAEELNQIVDKIVLEKFGHESKENARSCFNHGRTNYFKGDFIAAEKWYNKSVKIYEQLSVILPIDLVRSLRMLGVVNSSLENYKLAVEYGLKAKLLCEKSLGKEDLQYAYCLSNLSDAYVSMGQYDSAEKLILESIDITIKKQGKLSLDYSKSLSSLANLYFKMGYYIKVEMLFNEASSVIEKTMGTENFEYAYSLNNLANIYYALGQFDKVEPLYLVTKELLEKLNSKEHPFYAMAFINLGNLYRELGNYSKAESFYLNGIELTETTSSSNHNYYATFLTNLASLYSDMGNNERALKFYSQAKTIIEQNFGKDHAEYSAILLNIGLVYCDQGNYTESELLLLESEAIRKKLLGENHPDYAWSLYQLGNLYLKKNDYVKSEKYFLKGKLIWESILGKNQPEYTMSLKRLSKLYELSSRKNESEILIAEACELEQNRLMKAVSYLSENELSKYIVNFEKGNKDVNSYNYRRLKDNTNFTSGKLSSLCFDNVLFYKGFLLSAATKFNNIGKSSELTEEIYSRIQGLHRRLAAEYSKPKEERINIAELEEKLEKTEKEIGRIVGGYEEFKRKVSWHDLQVKLKKGSAAIEFIDFNVAFPTQTDSVIYAAVIIKSEDLEPQFIPLFEEKQLSQLLSSDSTTLSISDLYTSRGATPINAVSYAGLYDLIWKPLDSILQGISTVYYSPSGLLHRINFDAIPVDSKRNLSDKIQFFRLGSTRSIAVPDVTRIDSSNKVFLLGGIQYNCDTTLIKLDTISQEAIATNDQELSFAYVDRGIKARESEWVYLPGTEKEISNVSKLLGKSNFSTTTYSGKYASEENFKLIGKGETSPRVLHIATHGFFFPDPDRVNSAKVGVEHDSTTSERTTKAASPRSEVQFEINESVFKISDHPMIRSGLILAGGNYAWKEGKTYKDRMEDGILTAYEISQMNLSNTELVVLSACETGLGDIQGNEGVYGLQRAFKIAGAKYLIMSLWQVPDKQTSLLMTTFYKKWLENKMTIPAAFHAAQKELRDLGLDPYQWAGFVLVE